MTNALIDKKRRQKIRDAVKMGKSPFKKAAPPEIIPPSERTIEVDENDIFSVDSTPAPVAPKPPPLPQAPKAAPATMYVVLPSPITADSFVRDAEGGYRAEVERALEAGLSPNCRDNRGVSPLEAASRWGHLGIVELLISMGADPGPQYVGEMSSMMLAAKGGHVAVMKALKKAGGSIHDFDSLRKSPLLYAAESGSYEACDWLLKEGANPKRTDSEGNTPVSLAGENRRLVSLLKKYGAK